jgi:hypothetical protein
MIPNVPGVLQEFVEVAEPVVTRVEFVGGELLYGVRILVTPCGSGNADGL